MTPPGEPRRHARHAVRGLKSLVGVRLVALAATTLLGFGVVVPAAAEPTPTATSGLAFTIVDSRITESSGLARDPDNTVFWTVNDSGDAGIVYAVGPDGRTRGILEFDAQPIDVEALAYAQGTLYVADIGDNTRSRESVRIYTFDSPVPDQQRGGNYTAYDFVYPDGAHDAETLLVDDDGRIHIVTKDSPGAIFRAPRRLSAGSASRLTRVANAPAYVTDGTVLPSGQFAVRTYLSVEILEPELYAPVARAPLPFQVQGESITVSLGEDALLIGTEGPVSPVLRVPIPTQLAVVPSGAPTPPVSPTPTSTAASLGGGGTNRTGTLVALALALLASIGAGLVVFFRDRGHDVRSRPDPQPRRLWDVITPGGQSGTPEAQDEDHDRTVIRRPPAPDGGRGAGRSGHRREIWDLRLPDDEDGPTEIRR